MRRFGSHIAREFSSSHVPVREAFGQLEAQHLVVAVPRRGVRVAPLDTNSVKEIAEMRAALEVVALRNATPKFTSAHLARIELALIEADNAETMHGFEAANRAFHHALVAPCGMPRLLASLDGLQLANSRLVFAMARSVGWRPRSNQDHRLILQALRARNVDQACSLLARHIQTIERLAIPAEASSSKAGQCLSQNGIQGCNQARGAWSGNLPD